MTIESLTSGGTSALASIQRIVAQTTTSAAASAGETEGDTSSVSGPAKTLSKLKSLQASDPEKFAQTMSAISDKLSQAAGAATDPGEKRALSDLATKFETAGKTGDLSALAPHKGGAHGGPRHPHGAGGAGRAHSASASSSSTGSSDPADANQDGTVSEAERQAYEAKESTSTSSSKGAEAYRKMTDGPDASKMHALMDQVSGIVDAALG